MSNYECRRFSRVEANVPAQVTGPDGASVDAETRDLSLLGASFFCTRTFTPDQELTITFFPEPEKEIVVKAAVIREVPPSSMLAVYFTAVRSDTFETLRDLLVERGKHAAQVDEEIAVRRDLWPDTY